MADPNEVASLIFGEGVSPAEVQAFIQLYNLIAQENGLPLVEGNVFPDAIFEQMQQDDNFLFSVQTAILDTERVLVEIEQEAAAPPEPEDGVAPPPVDAEAPPPVGEPLTIDQIVAQGLSSSDLEDVFNFAALTGRNPTQAELDNIIQPDINFADQLEQIYFGALTEAGLWPPRSDEYRNFINDRFKAVLNNFRGAETPENLEVARQELQDEANLPPKENVWIRQEQERIALREQFRPAFERVAAEMELFTGLPDDVRANAEDRLLRQFVEAKVRNPATVVAEDFVRENLTRTIQQVQRQFQATPPVPTFELEGEEARRIEAQEAEAALELAETTEDIAPEEVTGAAERVAVAGQATREAEAFRALREGTTGPGVRVLELSREQEAAFERVIGAEDPGFQDFLRQRFPSFESPSVRALRQEAAALPGGGAAITGGATFESFLRETFSGLQAETPEALQAEATRQRTISQAETTREQAVASRQRQRGRRRATTFVLPPR